MALEEYVRDQTRAGQSPEAIRQACLAAGWPAESVERALAGTVSDQNVPGWLSFLSGGRVRTERAANLVMVGIALVCFGITGYLVFSRLVVSSNSRLPAEVPAAATSSTQGQ